MTLRELKKVFRHNQLPVQLLSQESNVYICQVDGKYLLTRNDHSPVVFHSIIEAKEPPWS